MPSVGHYANMSKHKPEVKIAILEDVEARLNRVFEVLHEGYEPVPGVHWKIHDVCELMGVFDPVNTEWDMVVFLTVNSMKDYDMILGAYFDPSIYEPGQLEKVPRESADVFNASTSKTEIYYTAHDLRTRMFPYLPT
ncbi:MAG: hypothetical protein GTO54_04720 [Nitrososphaeria archaeon]|nr:hypothetical protein [Nitrososphaeria archaeon]